MQDEQMIEALPSDAAQEALADRIRSRGVIWRCENLDATRLGNSREGHAKLAIVIPDEVLRSYDEAVVERPKTKACQPCDEREHPLHSVHSPL